MPALKQEIYIYTYSRKYPRQSERCLHWHITSFFFFKLCWSIVDSGNGNPLQYSCLENPVDGGTGWLPSREPQRVGHACVSSLSHSWCAGLCELQAHSKVSQLCTYIHTHSPYSQTLFPRGPLQSIEQSPPCSTGGPCLLSALQREMCICQSQSPNLPLPPSPQYPCLFSTAVTLFLFCK